MAGKVTAIVLAAGKGSRMNSDTPKQYLTLLGKPVLFYSLQAFEESDVDNIVLVIGSGEQEYCKKEIVQKYQINKVTHIVEGGAERYHSVWYGLMAAEGTEYVLIHDGARPLISSDIINKAISVVKETGACVVGMPVKDTIQIVDEEHMELFRIIKRANDLITEELLYDKYDEIMSVLDELKEYTKKHFGDEEEYMTNIGYEALDAQKKAHQVFVDKLEDINLEDMDENQQQYLIDIVDFLLMWLVNHILKMDKKIPVK